MHNIKEIRKNIKFFEKKIKQRNTKIDFSLLIKLDQNNRELIRK